LCEPAHRATLCYNSPVSILYLVATPIGNLKDISLRALDVLKSVTLIAAEDTRHSRKLLNAHHIATPLISYHEHNKLAREERMLSALGMGDVALISDAGTPVVSDPGYELVQAALANEHQVVPIPGPSAPIAALIASGLPADSFTFLGYLPRRAAERRSFLAAYKDHKETLLMFEVPHRLKASLEDLQSAFGASRRAVVCREMTKMHEEFQRGTLGVLIEEYRSQEPRGEITLVIEGALNEKKRWDEDQVLRELRRRLENGEARSSAAREIAADSGWKRQTIYRLSLEE